MGRLSAPDFTAMRHVGASGCGGIALLMANDVLDNPRRKILAEHLQRPDGVPVKAGEPVRCAECGETVALTPSALMPDRGPDRRRSKLQDLVLTLSERILFKPRGSAL